MEDDNVAILLSRVKTRDMPNVETLGGDKNDFFVELSFGDIWSFKTASLLDTKGGSWKYVPTDAGAVFNCDKSALFNEEMNVKAWDCNRFTGNTLIGEGKFELSNLLEKESKNKITLKLFIKIDDAPRGQVHIDFKVGKAKSPTKAKDDDGEIEGKLQVNKEGDMDLRVRRVRDKEKDREKETLAEEVLESSNDLESSFKLFNIGERVEVKLKSDASYFPCRITGVNWDGTYDVEYNDHEESRGIKARFIRTDPNADDASDRQSSPSRVKKLKDRGSSTVHLVGITVENLKDIEWIGENDPYVVLTWTGPGGSWEFKTRHLDGAGSNAVFKITPDDADISSFSCTPEHIATMIISAKVYDHNYLRTDVLIGEGDLEICSLTESYGAIMSFSTILYNEDGTDEVGKLTVDFREGGEESSIKSEHVAQQPLLRDGRTEKKERGGEKSEKKPVVASPKTEENREELQRVIGTPQQQQKAHREPRQSLERQEYNPAPVLPFITPTPPADQEPLNVFMMSVDAKNIAFSGTRGGVYHKAVAQNDPYVVIELGKVWSYRTATKMDGGPAPSWDYFPADRGTYFECDRDALRKQTVRARVYDAAAKASSNNKAHFLVGEGELSLSSLVERSGRGEYDVVKVILQLLTPNSRKPCGTLLVRLRLEPSSKTSVWKESYRLGNAASTTGLKAALWNNASLRRSASINGAGIGSLRMSLERRLGDRSRAADKEEAQILQEEMDNLIISNRRLQDALDSAHRYAEARRAREGEVLAELDGALEEVETTRGEHDCLMAEADRKLNEYKVMEIVWQDERKMMQHRVHQKENEANDLRAQQEKDKNELDDTSEGPRDDMMEEISALVKANAVLQEALDSQKGGLTHSSDAFMAARVAFNKTEESLREHIATLEADAYGKQAAIERLNEDNHLLHDRLDEEMQRNNQLAEERALEATRRAREEFEAKEKMLEGRCTDYQSRVEEHEAQVLRLSARAEAAEEQSAQADQRLAHEKRLAELTVEDALAMHNAQKAEWARDFEGHIRRIRRAHVAEMDEATKLWRSGQERITELEVKLAGYPPAVDWNENGNGEESNEYGSDSFEAIPLPLTVSAAAAAASSLSNLIINIRAKFISCDGLPNVEMLGIDENDPYVVIDCGEFFKYRTEPQQGAGSGAQWEIRGDDEKASFTCDRMALSGFKGSVKVFDNNKLRPDTCIGSGTVELEDISDQYGKAIQIKSKLTNDDGEDAGNVSIEFLVSTIIETPITTGLVAHQHKGNNKIVGNTIFLEHTRSMRTRLVEMEDRIAEGKRREQQLMTSVESQRKQAETAMSQRNAAFARASESDAKTLIVERQATEVAKQVESVRRERQDMRDKEEKLRAECVKLAGQAAEFKKMLATANNKLSDMYKDLSREKKINESNLASSTKENDILKGEWMAERLRLVQRLGVLEEEMDKLGVAIKPNSDSVVYLCNATIHDLLNVESWGRDNDLYFTFQFAEFIDFKSDHKEYAKENICWQFDEDSSAKFECEKKVIGNSSKATIKVFNKNKLTKDVLIGSADVSIVSLARAPNGKVIRIVANLTSPLGDSAGQIILELKMISSDVSTHKVEEGRKDKVKQECLVTLENVRAYNLQDVEFMGKNDPYCILTIGNEWSLTTTAKGDAGAETEWRYDEEDSGTCFEIEHSALEMQVLRVTMMEKNEFQADRCIGEGVAQIDELVHAQDDSSVLLNITIFNSKSRQPSGNVDIRFKYQVVIGAEEAQKQHQGQDQDESQSKARTTTGPSTDKNLELIGEGVGSDEMRLQLIALQKALMKANEVRLQMTAWKVAAEARIKELRKKLISSALLRKKASEEGNTVGDCVFSLEWSGEDYAASLRERFGHVANMLDKTRENLRLQPTGARAIPEEGFKTVIESLIKSKTDVRLAATDSGVKAADKEDKTQVPFKVIVHCTWDLDSTGSDKAIAEAKAVRLGPGARPGDLMLRPKGGEGLQGQKYFSWTDTNGMTMAWSHGLPFSKEVRFSPAIQGAGLKGASKTKY